MKTPSYLRRLSVLACLLGAGGLFVLTIGVRHSDGVPFAVRIGGPDISHGQTEPVCGNGKKEPGEECDDGNTIDTDTCTSACFKAKCGDYFVQKGEDCDPPGVNNCSAFCIDPNRTGGSSSSFRPRDHCGNGVPELAKGEECDMGVNNGISPLCTSQCKRSYCGDGIIGPTEECEPARDASGEFVAGTCGQICSVPSCTDGSCSDGCKWRILDACPASQPASSVSQAQAGFSSSGRSSSMAPASSASSESSSFAAAPSAPSSASPVMPASSSEGPAAPEALSSESSSEPVNIEREARCGDGRLEGVEQCDDGNVSGGDDCTEICVIERSAAPFCGNGIREGDEECDEGSGNSMEPDRCRPGCVLPRCGDGITDASEQCDDGNIILGDACTPSCLQSICGNGVLEPGEECDDGSRNSDIRPNSCGSDCLVPRCGDGILDDAFAERCDTGADLSDELPGACRTDCQPARCGDLVIDEGEACDDGNADPDDGCHRCESSRCPDGSAAMAGVCVLRPAAPLCIGDDCVTESAPASPGTGVLLSLLSMELAATVALLLRVRRMARGVRFTRDGKGDVFLQSR